MNDEPEVKYESLKKKYKALREVSALLVAYSRSGVYESAWQLGRKSASCKATYERKKVSSR